MSSAQREEARAHGRLDSKSTFTPSSSRAFGNLLTVSIIQQGFCKSFTSSSDPNHDLGYFVCRSAVESREHEPTARRSILQVDNDGFRPQSPAEIQNEGYRMSAALTVAHKIIGLP